MTSSEIRLTSTVSGSFDVLRSQKGVQMIIPKPGAKGQPFIHEILFELIHHSISLLSSHNMLCTKIAQFASRIGTRQA